MATLPRIAPSLVLGLCAVALCAATVWLRAPGFGFQTWNVDEAIHASVARRLLDGGVLYRDAVDQRTPLTYVAMAGILRVAGTDNLAAVHACLAVLIAATGALLFLALRRRAGTAAATWAALLYPTLATTLFYVGDANAFVTEWFVAFFTSAAAWCFWGGTSPRVFLTGVCIALAFLSKQPGALDLAAPALALVLWSRVSGENRPAGRRTLLALTAGFALPVLLVLAYYAARGALGDFVFYTWTYNVRYYGPAVAATERAATALLPLRLLFVAAPLLLGIVLAGVAAAIFHVVQRQRTAAEDLANPLRLYLLAWAASATLGAAAGGRGFDHYAIQTLPALCAGAGWVLGGLSALALGRGVPTLRRWAAAAAIVVVVLPLASAAGRARTRTLPIDPSVRVARFIAARTAPDERIFAWGYHPDIYLFADRVAGSRFVYASFQTGLLPWTNVAPEIDTRATVVPGAMETLLRDLQASRPAFIVDCSAGPNRHWQKYPLAHFPSLAAFIERNYVPVESAQFVAQGFRLFAITDEFRTRRAELPASRAATRRGEIGIFPTGDSPRIVRVAAGDSGAQLRRVELREGGRVLHSITLAPADSLTVDFPLPSDLGAGSLVARAIASDGAYFESAPYAVEAAPASLPREELAAFAVPRLAERIEPSSVIARFGAQASEEDGHRVFFAHAPSTMRFAVPDAVTAVRGEVGFRPGAFAPDNRTPTDGAEFQVRCTTTDGAIFVLFRHTLNPVAVPADRAPFPFTAPIPTGTGRTVEFAIMPGAAGNPASDWTFWRDLVFENSR
ncbi:MAG: hypothetical protein KF715_06920 [Candidatus Didemnitutus sp.]|nr:hypothetical protein [Candidatus Didemnitutus sp.]